jgi:hypothetical protein
MNVEERAAGLLAYLGASEDFHGEVVRVLKVQDKLTRNACAEVAEANSLDNLHCVIINCKEGLE